MIYHEPPQYFWATKQFGESSIAKIPGIKPRQIGKHW
jgi:hypothetical protein